MKKACLAFYLIGLTSFFLSCDKTRNKLNDLAKPFKEAQKARLEKAEQRLRLLNDSVKKAFGFSATPTEPIDSSLARLYIGEFLRPDATTAQRSKSLTESVWIDKKAIADMMLTLLNQEELDGIRIYYSKYPENVGDFDPDVKYPNRETLIFVCTKLDGNKHVDKFYPKKSKSDGLYIYDYNSLCPEQCEGATLGGY